MSSLNPGNKTNAGRMFRILCETQKNANMSILYEQGVQWTSWRNTLDVIEGRGINRQICRAYGFIASHYRPGDRIFLLGYSRGAYAVRSLAGIIDRVGLLRADETTERNIRQIYQHYQNDPDSYVAAEFADSYCHSDTEIEMVGVWDTVRALGIHWPILWRFSRVAHNFHNYNLGRCIRHGFHAIAFDESRQVYAPVMWQSHADSNGILEQVWFRGTHGDVGGQLSGFAAARPLSNIPLVWMLEKMEQCGIALPVHWHDRFVQDVTAPSVGTLSGWSLIFFRRKRRRVGVDSSERLHPSLQQSIRLHDNASR